MGLRLSRHRPAGSRAVAAPPCLSLNRPRQTRRMRWMPSKRHMVAAHRRTTAVRAHRQRPAPLLPTAPAVARAPRRPIARLPAAPCPRCLVTTAAAAAPCCCRGPVPPAARPRGPALLAPAPPPAARSGAARARQALPAEAAGVPAPPAQPWASSAAPPPLSWPPSPGLQQLGTPLNRRSLCRSGHQRRLRHRSRRGQRPCMQPSRRRRGCRWSHSSSSSSSKAAAACPAADPTMPRR